MKRRITFDIHLKEWLEAVENLPQCISVGITPSIASINNELQDDFPGDPVDRIIVATAIDLKIPLSANIFFPTGVRFFK